MPRSGGDGSAHTETATESCGSATCRTNALNVGLPSSSRTPKIPVGCGSNFAGDAADAASRVPETVADRVHPDELDQTETEPDLCTEIYVLVEVVQDVFEFADPPEERSERRLLADYPEGEGACLTAPDQSYRCGRGFPTLVCASSPGVRTTCISNARSCSRTSCSTSSLRGERPRDHSISAVCGVLMAISTRSSNNPDRRVVLTILP